MSAASRITAAIASLAAGLLLTSCVDGTGRDATYGLVVTPELADLNGETVVADGIIDPDRELVPGSRILMWFTGNTVSVNAGCNTFRGTASIEDGELLIPQLAGTTKRCTEPQAAQDQWLVWFMTSRPDFERIDDDLYLSHHDTTIHLTPHDD